jgi:hypothetical protein
MNGYELRIRGLADPISFAAARRELLVFPEVRDLVHTSGGDRFVVLYEGESPDPAGWCSMLLEVGYPAIPAGRIRRTGDAA